MFVEQPIDFIAVVNHGGDAGGTVIIAPLKTLTIGDTRGLLQKWL